MAGSASAALDRHLEWLRGDLALGFDPLCVDRRRALRRPVRPI